MLFKFESVNGDGCVVTQEFDTDVWTEALDYFVKFLRGSGYSLDYTSVGVNVGKHCVRFEELSNVTCFSEE